MERGKVTDRRVKAANRQFYDAVAERYEEIDGRRSPKLQAWLRESLCDLRGIAPGGRLLDIGAGGGLVTRCAEGLFALRVAIDISARILAVSRRAFDLGVAADVDRLPFADNSFDAVTCFSVLHHLYSFERLVSETARVLRPGGVFYSDHDMDAAFSGRFRLPILLYRKLRNASSKYREASDGISQELYDLTEWQESGVDASGVARLLEAAGFSVEVSFHWFGLTRVTDRLFGRTPRKRGWAPLMSVRATRSREG